MFPIRPALILIALSCLLFVGCSDDATDPVDNDPPPAETEYATLVYRLDDSLNATYTAADGLAWKGPFTFDAATGIITVAAGSGGPFPLLHDDGPAAAGGHEPDGETAADGVWTVAVRVASPAADWTFDFWPISGAADGADGPILWSGAGGSLTVTAGETGTVTAPGETFVPRTQAAPLSFRIDDSANASYTAADGLAWKGSFSYDPVRRVLSPNGSWAGPYVLLHDDGPWTAGGHEPHDAAAGDHIWSVAVWVDNSQGVTLEYGAISGSTDGSDGTWIWSGANGVVTLPAGQTDPVAAPGLTLPAWGTIDLMVVMDLSANGANLPAPWSGTDWTGSAAIKGSFTHWQEIALTAVPEIGVDHYAFQLSVSAGPHDGLLETGNVIEWVMVLGGAEYRVDGAAANQMVMPRFHKDGDWLAGFDAQVQPDGSRNLTLTVP